MGEARADGHVGRGERVARGVRAHDGRARALRRTEVHTGHVDAELAPDVQQQPSVPATHVEHARDREFIPP